MFKSFMLVATILLAACGAKLSGTYVGQGMFERTSLTFQDNGKVVIDNMGIKAEVPFEFDGKRIKIMAMGGVDTTLQQDGSIELPGGARYVKTN